MNNNFILGQMTKTVDLNVDLIMTEHILDKTAKLMEIKATNPKSKQSGKTRELKVSSSTLQRYRRKINMLSPYRIPPSSNTHTRKQKTSNHSMHELKVTSIDLKMTSNDLKMITKDVNEIDTPVFKKTKTKNGLRGGDPNDNPTHGCIFFEPPFSSPINGCVSKKLL